MKKIFFLLLFSTLFNYLASACTTFVLKTNKGIFFGRNLDWISDHGILVLNQRNVAKSSLTFNPEVSAAWVSKYGSISFNQFGKEFPYGGMNEKGLVVEVMRSRAEYPIPDHRPMVNELQWVQYQLDNCTTVDEVIATDNLIRIGQTHEDLHYLVCDASGNTAVIEFLNGKMVFYDQNEIPVLENEPYDQSLKNYSQHSTSRFSIAANLIQQYNENLAPVAYSFSILQEVALTGEWSVVYDVSNQEIHFVTKSNTQVRNLQLRAFDFSCSSPSLSYDLLAKDKGSIHHLFSKLSLSKNKQVIKEAIALHNIMLDQDQIVLLVNYLKEVACED